MCGRYTLYSDKKEIENQFEAEVRDEELLTPDYNITPGSMRPVVLIKGTDERIVERLKWGFIPSFVTKTSDWSPLINARSETVSEKPSFRKAFHRKRCIIPANGFYEWKKFGDDRKIPFYIRLLDQELFGMAGIYESQTDSDGNEMKTFLILTTQANALIQPLHDRMPVILRSDDYKVWLDPVHSQTGTLESLMAPYPLEDMSTYKVDKEVNNPKNNRPDLINPKLK